jgi:dTDP-4-dehydrorhamnose reductase
MKPGQSLTIVGGDSLIGSQILIECEKVGVSVQASTRRTEQTGDNRFFLDLTASQPEKYLPTSSAPILIVAAKTGFDRCDSDPTSTKVNIEAPVLLAKAALAAGRRVVFVSTDSVFGGDLPFCNEYDAVMPQATYSKQKAEAEQQLSALPGWAAQGAIVRLTKVLSPNRPPIMVWRKALDHGEPIAPFTDMVFSPVSVQFAAKGLMRIALSDHCGNFHLSGATDVTYVEFACQYVAACNGNDTLVTPTTSTKAGVNLLFNRRYSALGMIRTQQSTGISAQSLTEVVMDLLATESCPKAAL